MVIVMTKYTIDCFTSKSIGTQFPENTYYAEDLETVSKIVRNCSNKITGIRMVQVWINKHDEEKTVESKKE